MGEDRARSKDWLRAPGITCVLQTQFSSSMLSYKPRLEGECAPVFQVTILMVDLTSTLKYHNSSTALERSVMDYLGTSASLTEFKPSPAASVVVRNICSSLRAPNPSMNQHRKTNKS